MAQSDDLTSEIQENAGEGVEIHDTKDPEIIYITNRMNLKDILRDYKDEVLALRAWTNPFAIFITVFSAFMVTDFEQTFGFQDSFWESVFFLFLIGSFIWLVYSLIIYYTHKDEADIENVMKKLEADN